MGSKSNTQKIYLNIIFSYRDTIHRNKNTFIFFSDSHSNSTCIIRQQQYLPRSSVYSSKWNSRRNSAGYCENTLVTSLEIPRRTICTFCLADVRKSNTLPDADKSKNKS